MDNNCLSFDLYIALVRKVFLRLVVLTIPLH